MPAQSLVTPESEGLGWAVRQVWAEAVESGDARIVTFPSSNAPGWRTLRRFSVVPKASAPDLLIERPTRPTFSYQTPTRMLRAYAGLRKPRPRLARYWLSMLAAAKLPVSKSGLELQIREGFDYELEILSVLQGALGHDFAAIVGLRRGANGKAAIHTFDDEGHPTGLAKLSWTPLTRSYVEHEGAVMRELRGRVGRFRVPQVIEGGRFGREHYLLTEPLPASVKQQHDPLALTKEELGTLFPPTSASSTATMAYLAGLTETWSSYHPEVVPAEVSGAGMNAVARLQQAEIEVAVADRWHGDLVPWNVARDADGQAWVWDWESSESEVPAGLDLLHWYIHTQRNWSRVSPARALMMALPEARSVMHTWGMRTGQQTIAASIYALAIAERSCGLAHHNDGWHRVRLSQRDVMDLIEVADHLRSSSTN